ATVKGGAGGAADPAGNPLAGDTVWSFTTAPPAAPSNLSATRGGSSSKQFINLSWTDNASNEAKFVIERSTARDFSTIDASFEVPANTTSYKDTQVAATTTYYYRVYAVAASGMRSAPSNVVSATTK
nr:fibronectin type III domain-containing protein [Actinomycetota bacterium]